MSKTATLSKESISKTIIFLAEKLKDSQYCIRGTSSLVLQNTDMGVQDIDILCNKNTALKANELFKDFVVDPVDYKESPKFKSYFGKFVIDGINMEIIGDWQIKDTKGNWSRVLDGSSYNVVDVDGVQVKVTKIEDELEAYLLMGRFNAYHKLRKQVNLPKQVQSGPGKVIGDSLQKSLFD